MKVVANITVSLPADSWERLQTLQKMAGGNVETILADAFRLYEFALQEAGVAALRSGKLHLAVKLPDGSVELGEEVFGEPSRPN